LPRLGSRVRVPFPALQCPACDLLRAVPEPNGCAAGPPPHHTTPRKVFVTVQAFSPNRRRLTKGILILLLLVVVLFGAVVARVAEHEWETELPPPLGTLLVSTEQAGVAGMTDVKIPVDGQPSLGAWYVAPRHGAVVIITHGSGSDRSSMLPTVRLLNDAGIGSLAFDWPGHGTSGGKIQWGQAYRNALSATARWADEQPGVDRAQLGVIGFSYGGYITAQVAAMDTVFHRIALIGTPSDASEQTYSAYARYTRLGGWVAIKTDEILGVSEPDTLKAIDMVARFAPRPLLIITGGRDPAVPTRMADTLLAHARNPKRLLRMPQASHGDYVQVDSATYGAALREFFAPELYPAAPSYVSAAASDTAHHARAPALRK
jgi:uncharacterized protein